MKYIEGNLQQPFFTMMKLPRLVTFVMLSVALMVACNKTPEAFHAEQSEEVEDDTGVRFEMESVPYENLSDYRFYIGDLKNLQPNNRVLPYEPINSLFSDYAKKSRFVWMPEGVSATYVDDHQNLNFPDGTVLIKNFFYDNVLPMGERKILETRLIYRKEGQWHFADYKWNEAQTEAVFDLNGSNVPLNWVDENNMTKFVNFRIPSEVECFTCHKSAMQGTPLGTKPNLLNKVMVYEDGSMNQLEKWKQQGYLQGTLPANIETTVDWTDESQPLSMRFRSYIDVNCSHCHSAAGHCYYRPIRFPFHVTTNEDSLGICILPDEQIPVAISNQALTHLISRGNALRSVLHFRLATTNEQYRMPLLGRTLVHEEGLELVEAYINSLSPACE